MRDLDLQTRMFKFPCSYLIYSEAFNALPVPALDYVKSRLGEIFSGKDSSKEYAHLTAADRGALREILAATWKGAPEKWKK